MMNKSGHVVESLVLMGVSGSGKTTIGRLLASRLQFDFVDADDFHSETNRRKLSEGIPLNHQDRLPWLRDLNGELHRWYKHQRGLVLACSALRASYRELLLANVPSDSYRMVQLEVDVRTLRVRMEARQHEFMNPKLLESQLSTFEDCAEALHVWNIGTPEAVAASILRGLQVPSSLSKREARRGSPGLEGSFNRSNW